MSETAYERGYRVGQEQLGSQGQAAGAGVGPQGNPVRASGSGSGVLSNKFGPLPVWAWMVITLVVILGVAYWRNRNKSATSTANSSPTTGTGQIPQFVNQTYTQVTPPNVDVTTSSTTPVTVNNNPPIRPGAPPSDNDNGTHGGSPPTRPPIHVGAQHYTVKKGDTLLSLSQKFLGTTNRTLLAHANGLGTGAGLRVGQVLTIPAHNAPVSATSPIADTGGDS